jgi:hypothetical protein
VSALVGTASDELPDLLATGRTDVTAMFVSMSARHPDGGDADYIGWHTFDHRPEQHRLASIRASLRLVSTPACRAARAAGDARYDAVDHVMTYFFVDITGLEEFNDLSIVLASANRTPYLLPLVERGVFGLDGTIAAPRIKVGADVLPFWPARGVYLLVERGARSPAELTEVAGVAGAWWGPGLPVEPPYATADHTGLQISYCFLDGDPADTAALLRPALEQRWTSSEVAPLLAAPFHTVAGWDCTRHLP